MKIYHNPRCKKSRETLSILNKNNCKIEIIDYIKEPLNKKDLSIILKKLNILAIDLVRKNEIEWRKRDVKNLDNEQIINLMIKFPKLMQRPIVTNGDKAIIGRPPDNVYKIMT
tara:strand:+ start:23637 stop:23975 length:339 start_codon:yes stop_codon:yes gene_type:complete